MLPEIGTQAFIDFLDAINKGAYHETYKQAIDHSEDMGVHIWGTKPYKILNRTRPREDPEVRQYRIESYEAVTKGKADKAISILYQIFKSSLYNIAWKDTTSGQQLEQYLTQDFPVFGDFILYIREVLFKNMLADPNGAIIMLPGDFLIDETERVMPIPFIVYSDQILDFAPGEYFIIKDRAVNITDKGAGAILHVITADEIITYFEFFNDDGTSFYQAQERGNPNSWTFRHNLGDIPIWLLGGNVNGQFQGFLYDSFFAPALPYWNKAVNSESDLDGAFYVHMHPFRVELAEDCDFEFQGQMCQNGQWYDAKGKQNMTCPKCNGSGKNSLAGPYGIFQVSKDKLEQENATSFDPVSYVTVPTEPTKLLKERRDKQLKEGLEAINMDIINETGENQSGIAKEIDRTELRTFMLQVSDFVYDNHVFNIIWFTNLYMFGTEQGDAALENIPEISKPVQFDTLTERELTAQISRAKEADLSAAYLVGLQLDINKKQFNNSPEALERADLTVLLNPLPEKDEETIMNMVAEGSTSPEHAGVALNIDFLVSVALQEDSFKEMSMIDKFNRLVEIARDENLIPSLTNGVT